MKSKTLLHHINVLWSWNKRMSTLAPSHCSERPSHFQSSAAGDLHQLQRVPMNRPTDEVDNCTSNLRCSNPCTIVSLKVKLATFWTYSNMYAYHMSCCCWYHSCFAGLFFLERFDEKNGDQNQRKSGTEIKSQDQKILFRTIGCLMSSITTLHHIQHLLQRFSGRLQQCHTQIHSVFLLAISSIARQWHIHRIWERFVSTSQGCRSFEVFQLIDIVNDKEVNV